MKIGFIGCGNMGKAMIGGILQQGICEAGSVRGADIAKESNVEVSRQYGIAMTTDNCALVRWAEIVVLSVKPQYYEGVIAQIRDEISKQLVITIAPGKTLSWLRDAFGKEVKIVRCMPNTPALVGAGMTGICFNQKVTKQEQELALQLLGSFGKTEVVEESQMDAVVSVSGSSPAYVFMMIEAMADAAVAEGLPRSKAYEFAAQAVYGSAKMVLDTGKHPGELKDMVCSPAGTTIEAVRVLEDRGFRSALMEAMAACADKSRNL